MVVLWVHGGGGGGGGGSNIQVQWSRNDIHIGGAKRGVVDCFMTGVKS